MTDEHSDLRNWWPYVLPMASFLILFELSSRLGDAFDLLLLLARVAVPLAILAYFWTRGKYPELRFSVSTMTLIDLFVGVLLAGMWMGPYLLFPAIRPNVEMVSFDPAMAGQASVPFVLSLRLIGYAMVTPWMEELFMRSFLIRYAVSLESDADTDFRKISIGRFTWRSFLVVVIVFLATHQIWEWWVMLPWAVLTNLWFYYRKDLFSLIAVHAATNATILLAAICLPDYFADGAGGKLALWFFV